jgi:hypothetical protein
MEVEFLGKQKTKTKTKKRIRLARNFVLCDGFGFLDRRIDSAPVGFAVWAKFGAHNNKFDLSFCCAKSRST